MALFIDLSTYHLPFHLHDTAKAINILEQTALLHEKRCNLLHRVNNLEIDYYAKYNDNKHWREQQD